MRVICEATGMKRFSGAALYTEEGLSLHDEDLTYIKDGDTLYYDPEGKKFNT
jgi:hypothetical protein